ncbi:hypothetical protein Bhyg_05330 [Pseudolycoriella hygida]|uniref:Uncharacterized protein n=1 Tax=Pseudolycoriella hygida TaxID=35572 RepID=A0A9Q0NHU4_9DIPT|nr:hypothetical protein Bhyg_05330 [Pseudolycoriella hygida]
MSLNVSDNKSLELNLLNGHISKIEQEMCAGSNLNEPNKDLEGKPVYGLCGIKVKIFQRFLSAKWALFWLCWAGALQERLGSQLKTNAYLESRW